MINDKEVEYTLNELRGCRFEYAMLNAVCSNEDLASADLLFGGDLDKVLRAARESSKLGAKKRGDHRYRPYQHERNFSEKPFFFRSEPLLRKEQFRERTGPKGFGKWRRH